MLHVGRRFAVRGRQAACGRSQVSIITFQFFARASNMNIYMVLLSGKGLGYLRVLPSVCLSARNNSAPNGRIFMKFDTRGISKIY